MFYKIDTLAPFLFIICLDYVFEMALGRENELFYINWEKEQKISSNKKNDIAILTDKTDEAEILLHKIEYHAKDIGLSINADKTEFI